MMHPRISIVFLLISVSFCSNILSQTFHEVQKVVASDRAIIDKFGNAVDLSGRYAIAGAFTEDEDVAGGNNLLNAGSAYIFEMDVNGNWMEVQKIVASDRGADDNFGYAVAIDSQYAVIGSYKEDEDNAGGNTMINAGSAYIFERDSSGNWNEVQKITAGDRASSDSFGFSVAILGEYVFIGAPREDEDAAGGNTLIDAGSVYVYKRDSNGVWTQIQKIVAADRGGDDRFGTAIDIGDEFSLVGAPGENEDSGGANFMSNSGAAYVFALDFSSFWLQEQKLVANDRTAYDFFGNAVSVSGDDALVGAYLDNEDVQGNNLIPECGSAYFFERLSNGTWIQELKVVASDRAYDDYFGFAVSLEGDFAIIGTQGEDHDENGLDSLINAGSVYFFEDTDTGWREIEKLVASDREEQDYFGTAFALNGNHVFIGAFNEDEDEFGNNPISNAGSAYFFKFCRTSSVDSVVACNSYVWNGITFTASGVYRDTIPNAVGCDSVMTLVLTLGTVDASVTATDSSLSANAMGVNYQWVNCDSNYAPIATATNQAFYPSAVGNYAVIVTGSCVDTSACFPITIVGIDNPNGHTSFHVYPNPTDGLFMIDMGNINDPKRFSLSTIEGKVISVSNYFQASIVPVDLSTQPSGVYLIAVETLTGDKSTAKIVLY